MRAAVKRFLKDRRGATAIEYGLIVGLIFLVMIGGFGLMNDAMADMYKTIGEELKPPLG